MSTIKIDSDVPYIPRSGHNKGTTQYPIADLQPGQSFFVTGTSSPWTQQYMYRLIKQYRQQNSAAKFKTQIREEDGVKGVRVWRIA